VFKLDTKQPEKEEVIVLEPAINIHIMKFKKIFDDLFTKYNDTIMEINSIILFIINFMDMFNPSYTSSIDKLIDIFKDEEYHELVENDYKEIYRKHKDEYLKYSKEILKAIDNIISYILNYLIHTLYINNMEHIRNKINSFIDDYDKHNLLVIFNIKNKKDTHGIEYTRLEYFLKSIIRLYIILNELFFDHYEFTSLSEIIKNIINSTISYNRLPLKGSLRTLSMRAGSLK